MNEVQWWLLLAAGFFVLACIDNFGRVIGFDPAGNPASNIRIYVRDGIIQSAFPF